jgi:hypothetical protein
MKAILEFDLPEDYHEYKMANKANDMHSVLWDFNQWLRSKIKYHELSDEKYETLQECGDKLYELLTDHQIELQ